MYKYRGRELDIEKKFLNEYERSCCRPLSERDCDDVMNKHCGPDFLKKLKAVPTEDMKLWIITAMYDNMAV